MSLNALQIYGRAITWLQSLCPKQETVQEYPEVTLHLV